MALRQVQHRLRRRAQAGAQRRLALERLHDQVEHLDYSSSDSGGSGDGDTNADSESDEEDNTSASDEQEQDGLELEEAAADIGVDDDHDHEPHADAELVEAEPFFIEVQDVPPNDDDIVEPNEADLAESLHEWALRGVSFKKVDKLLKMLLPYHPTLPRNHKALLDTPRRSQTEQLGTGEFWYRGIAINLNRRLSREYLRTHQVIIIDINIDGLSPFESTPLEMWPILGCLLHKKEPFVIAMYCGPNAPQDIDLYLRDYVQEVRHLLEHGFEIFGNIYRVQIRNYILDAPARAKMKCIISHNGTFACEKCEVQGRKILNCMVFEALNAPRRTDQSFAQRTNDLHHRGDSPLEAIPTGMVSQFRLDSMHLIHLGCSKRWMIFVLGTKKRRGIAVEAAINEVERRRAAIANHIPSDFVRRSRSLVLRARYKASEYRRLMLYDGLVIFKNLPRNLWRNYLLYFTCIYIMSSPTLVRSKLDAAAVLVPHFIQHATRHLGRHFVVYNVHSLLHLIEECRQCGHLDSFSAFKFESYLGAIKSYLRSRNKPLQQIKNRCHETGGCLLNPLEEERGDLTLCQKMPVQEGFDEGDDFWEVKLHNFGTCLKISEADSCFETSDGSIVILSNIRHMPGGIVLLHGHRFLVKDDYFSYPINSSEVGIWKVSTLDQAKLQWNIAEFSRKCVLIPCLDENDVFVSIPLLHTGEQQM